MQYTTYTTEEKEIFHDHLVLKTTGHKKRFNQYLQNFYNCLVDNPQNAAQVQVTTRKNGSMPLIIKKTVHSQPFNTNHILWDEKTKDNLVTHFLSLPEFVVTNSNLHQLNLVHPDWTHENKRGDTPINLLAQRGQLEIVTNIAKDFKLDLDYKNKDNKPYTHFMFEFKYLDNIEKLDHSWCVYIYHHLRMAEKHMNEHLDHFDISEKRLLKLIDNLVKAGEKITQLSIDSEDSLVDKKNQTIQEQIHMLLNPLSNWKLHVQLKEKPLKSKIKI